VVQVGVVVVVWVGVAVAAAVAVVVWVGVAVGVPVGAGVGAAASGRRGAGGADFQFDRVSAKEPSLDFGAAATPAAWRCWRRLSARCVTAPRSTGPRSAPAGRGAHNRRACTRPPRAEPLQE
jgi:hypothetical protein